MGFKVTIRRNGAVCGEAHYKAEAVAAGIAAKATKANPDVSAAVTRCNGAGCGCGVKANRRRHNPAARRATVSMADVKAAVLAGADGGYLTDVARAPALRGVHFGRIQAAAEALAKAGKVSFDGATITRRNGTTSSEEAYWEGVLADLARLAKEEKEASKARARRSYSPHTKEEMARIVALDMDAPRRRNGTTSANIAASRSLARGLMRNGGARPTFAAVQKRIFNEFAAEGWTMSSPTLKVPHATSPDGKCRAWFKAQSIYFSRGGGRHELNTAHSALPGVDLRDIRPGVFVAWFEKHACAPYVHRTNGVRRRVARARVRRNSGSMTEAQASTLIQQLGGMGKLTAMIGASGFGRGTTDGHPSLTFKFKGSKKANVVTIILDPSDTYTVRFMRMAGPSKFYAVTPTGEVSGVYADQLRGVFERHTGLYLSL